MRGASSDATVATAAHDVLVELIGQLPEPFSGCAGPSIVGVEAAYETALDRIGPGDAKDKGVRLGRAAAATILADRTGDGSNTELFDVNARQGTAPGQYRFTPHCEPPEPPSCSTPIGFVFAPGWADVTPFTLQDSRQFRPEPPYEVTGEVRRRPERGQAAGSGHQQGADRRPDRDRPVLVRELPADVEPDRQDRLRVRSGPSVWEDARLFGLLNMAMADGYIGSFETKRHYYTWRPVTAIRGGRPRGNFGTTGDPTWTPLSRLLPSRRTTRLTASRVRPPPGS